LSVLLVRRREGASGPQWALPGAFLHQGERLAEAVTRSLAQKTGIAGHTLQKDTFRRAMEPHLRGTGTLSSGTVGRPSQRFRRAR
jgi:ADP-ribose pyrophosphatase YjhB (NUDIX family)